MNTNIMGRTILGLVPVLSIVLLLSAVQPAIAADSSYDVRHWFWWQPPSATLNVVTGVQWIHFEHAWADNRTSDNARSSQYLPSFQPVGFDPYGNDWMNWWGRVWNSGTAASVPVNETYNWAASVNPLPFGGLGGSRTATATDASTWARASTAWRVISWWGGRLIGWNRSWGHAHANPYTWSKAYAYSESKLRVWALTFNMRTGRIGWRPVWRDTASGSATATDPIVIVQYDADIAAPALEDSPLHIEGGVATAASADAYLAWEDGHLRASGVVDGEFHASVSSSYVPSQYHGSVDIEIEGEVVIRSEATGIFEGYALPSVGSSADFDIDFVAEIEFEIDYPEFSVIDPQTGPNMAIDFGGGGDGTIENDTPELFDPTDCAEVIAQGWGLPSDLNEDCYVGWSDFGIFAIGWQQCVDPNNPECDQPWLIPEAE